MQVLNRAIARVRALTAADARPFCGGKGGDTRYVLWKSCEFTISSKQLSRCRAPHPLQIRPTARILSLREMEKGRSALQNAVFFAYGRARVPIGAGVGTCGR